MRFLIFLIIISQGVRAQDTDTLLPSLLSIENDTLRASKLCYWGTSLRNIDPQLSYTYARYAEKEALQAGFAQKLPEIYNLLGILYYKKGDLRTALSYQEKNLHLTKDRLSIAYCLTNIANIYVDLKLFAKAEEAYLTSLQVYNEMGDQDNLAGCLINLGILKQTLGHYDAAFENYSKAFEIAKKLNSHVKKSICLNNMAQLQSDLGNYTQAIAMNYDALKIRDLMEIDVEKADTYLSLAEIFLKQKDIVAAEQNLKLAIDICTRFDYFDGKLVYLKLFSELNFQKKNFETAYLFLQRHQKLSDSLATLPNEPATLPDFKEPFEMKEANVARKNFPNAWLLALVCAFTVLIPFILIRYKR